MGIFSKIRDRIFGHDGAEASAKPTPSSTGTSNPGPASTPVPAPATSPAASVPAPESTSPVAVDVGAVLLAMADAKEGGGNYQTSIVDLLKLLDLDSSLAARKELAEELSVRVGADGSAEQNIALHRAVMAKLSANGGVVPESLRH
ncbi:MULTISPECIES: DUF3597 domain-containing protein [Sphingobium]|uniref:DUF3597 domain-containing protein n=1 Tax=Sphingobium TaxID=165695 RepID=UPI001BEA4109|nr:MULTISPECIES: DUF3597 domain-containing protein [Sphingobium]MBT2246334.1 DUF3597 domain-containing protein [Sphingobium sp. BHU LFT2]WBQ19262.1 DUF3597 domain-containing protein [Sphingobium yanoikuyae]